MRLPAAAGAVGKGVGVGVEAGGAGAPPWGAEGIGEQTRVPRKAMQVPKSLCGDPGSLLLLPDP